MATITLNYNARNTKAKNLLNYVISTGLLTPKTEVATTNHPKTLVFKDRVLNIEYTAVVRSIENGWYMAQCEQIQGALTQGRTVEETKENLKDAIYLLLKDEVEDLKKGNAGS